MLEHIVKFKCRDCGAFFEKKFFETLGSSLIKCPECGGFNVRNLSDYSLILDFWKKRNGGRGQTENR